jgi:hypothetical protein
MLTPPENPTIPCTADRNRTDNREFFSANISWLIFRSNLWSDSRFVVAEKLRGTKQRNLADVALDLNCKTLEMAPFQGLLSAVCVVRVFWRLACRESGTSAAFGCGRPGYAGGVVNPPGPSPPGGFRMLRQSASDLTCTPSSFKLTGRSDLRTRDQGLGSS